MRNENGFGSIVCLDKTGKKRRKPWAVRITTGWKNGKQQRKYIGYYRTQSEALVALAEYHKQGIGADLTNLTLNEVYDMWMKRIEQKGLSESTIRTHSMAYTRFGKLGTTAIKDIRNIQLQQWLDGADVKPNSKGKLRSTMHQVFEFAFKNDIINKNPATGLEITEKAEKTGSIFSTEEIAKLWEHKDHRIARQMLILVYTGMRIGELLQVRREDINLEEQYIIGGLKTEAGRNRVIPIHDKIIPLVREQLADGKYLVSARHGGSVTYSTIRVSYQKYLDKLGMTHKIHDTRKTAVSLMHSTGIPMETIRVIVGHSGKGVTEKVYLYKEPKELVEVINTMEIPF